MFSRELNLGSSRVLKGLSYTDVPIILVVLVVVVLFGLIDVSMVSECVSGVFEMSVWVLEEVPVLNGSSVLLPRVCECSLIKGPLKKIVFGFEGSLSEGSTQVRFKSKR